jgi:hypothetical protein
MMNDLIAYVPGLRARLPARVAQVTGVFTLAGLEEPEVRTKLGALPITRLLEPT